MEHSLGVAIGMLCHLEPEWFGLLGLMLGVCLQEVGRFLLQSLPLILFSFILYQLNLFSLH